MMDRRVCPRCGCSDIGLDASDFKSFGLGGAPMYRCNGCGLTSPIFPEISDEDDKDFVTDSRIIIDDLEVNGDSCDQGFPYLRYLAVGAILLMISLFWGTIIIMGIIVIQLFRWIIHKKGIEIEVT